MGYDSLEDVTVAGAGLRAQIGPVAVSGSLDLSATAVSQLSLRVLDVDLSLLRSRVLARGAAVNVEGLRLQVAAEGVDARGAAPYLTVDCRPRVVAALRARKGARTWTDLTTDAWLRLEVAAADRGTAVTAEPRPKRRQIIRRAEANQDPETSWDLLLRLAKEEGCWAWEAEGRIYYGRPSWLLANLPMFDVAWWAPSTGRDSTPALLGCPDVRWSDDDPAKGATGSMELLRAAAEVLTPGRGIRLGGSLGPFCQRYIVTGMKLDVGGRTGTVTFETPRNPTPEPPTEATPAAAPTPAPATTPAQARAAQPITAATRAAKRRASEAQLGPYNPDRHRRFEDGSYRLRKPGEKRDDVVRAEDGSWVSRSFYRRS